jgi:hypothetical protein
MIEQITMSHHPGAHDQRATRDCPPISPQIGNAHAWPAPTTIARRPAAAARVLKEHVSDARHTLADKVIQHLELSGFQIKKDGESWRGAAGITATGRLWAIGLRTLGNHPAKQHDHTRSQHDAHYQQRDCPVDQFVAFCRTFQRLPP